MQPITKIEIPGIKKTYSGKVRDIFTIDDAHLLIVSTDRLSAFDHIFPNGIPGKGIILNTISNLWFKHIKVVPNHLVETDFSRFPKPFSEYPEIFKDRSVIVKKTDRVDYECVARGYIIGSGWKDYQETGKVCGITLPRGLKMAEKLQQPIFTPATKADAGHDMNVPFETMATDIGRELSDKLKSTSLAVYEFAGGILEKNGILLADTKFEFGLIKGELILIDEVLTPDSSRFWDKSTYAVGTSPVSYDKQFIRDYLETTTWDKNSPPPPLPQEIVDKTRQKYEEILKKITAVFSN